MTFENKDQSDGDPNHANKIDQVAITPNSVAQTMVTFRV